MANVNDSARVGAALNTLLLRGTRQHLYERLVEGMGDGLSVTTYPVLATLALTGPCAISDLAREVGLDRSVVSRHADVLEAAGLLNRQAGADARVALLALTPAGRRAVATMQRRLTRIVERELRTWPPRRVSTFVQGLEQLVDQMVDGA